MPFAAAASVGSEPEPISLEKVGIYTINALTSQRQNDNIAGELIAYMHVAPIVSLYSHRYVLHGHIHQLLCWTITFKITYNSMRML